MVTIQDTKLTIIFIALIVSVFLVQAKTDIPVFLLSGQSNMSGYGSVNNLTSDQKKSIDNVKIYLDLVWEGVDSKERKWLTLGIGFGSTKDSIGPELYFGRTLSEAFPGQKIAIIKCSSGSSYLGKAADWLPPSSNNGNGGNLYKKMMETTTKAALSQFNSAFDTAQYTPRWAGFVWLQGEFDAMDQSLSNVYEENLTNLIKDIRAVLNVPELPVIIPMIDTRGQWTFHSTIRNANIAVVQKLKNVDTLDTKGFSSDGTHYKGDGQVKIGTIAAQRWIAMDYKYSPAVEITYHLPSLSSSHLNTKRLTPDIAFDLIGKVVSPAGKMNSQSSMHSGAYIIKGQTNNLKINIE
jgi:hypothetical protein